MKKLMTMIAAVATAFGLFADAPDPNTYYSTSFESSDAGCSDGKTFDWSTAGWETTYADELTLADQDGELPYAEGRVRRDEFFKEKDTNDKYLVLETGTNEIKHVIGGDGDRVFFDQLVKFTGYEEAPTIADGTKIAVWMSATDTADDVDGATNLYVTAGTGDTATNLLIAADVAVDTWYRLTIKSLGNVIDESTGLQQVGFLVYINGELATIVEDQKDYHAYKAKLIDPSGFYAKGQLFTAIDTTSATLASVGYAGIGGVDDIIFSKDAPDFAASVNVTVKSIDGALIEVKDSEGKTIALTSGYYTLPRGAFSVTYTADDDFILPGAPIVKNYNTEVTTKVDDSETVKPQAVVVEVSYNGAKAVPFADEMSAFNDIAEKTKTTPGTEVEATFIQGVTNALHAFDTGVVIAIGDDSADEPAQISSYWTLMNGNVSFLQGGLENNKIVTMVNPDEGDAFTLTFAGLIKDGASILADDIAVPENSVITLSPTAKVTTKTVFTKDQITAVAGYEVKAEPGTEEFEGYTIYTAVVPAPKTGFMVILADGTELAPVDTLAEALALIDDGATIKLLANVTDATGMSVNTKKTLTIDFAGFTYTVNKPGAGSTGTEKQAFQFLAGQTITLKGGTINVAEDNLTEAVAPQKNIMRLIQNYANLTLEDMTLDAENLFKNVAKDDAVRSIVEFANGTCAVTGSTSIINAGDAAPVSITIDTWRDRYPAGAAVTINTTGNIGTVSVYGEGESAASFTKSSLDIQAAGQISLIADASADFTVTKAAGVEITAPAGYKWENNALVAKYHGNYEIWNAADFADLQADVAAGETFAGKTFTLKPEAPITLENWTGIGSNSAQPFSGVFNGNGNSITVTYNATKTYLGFFNCLKGGAVVSNLTINASLDESTIDPKVDKFGFAALAGYVYDATIENVTVNGTIGTEQTPLKHNGAGLVVVFSTGDALVKNCVNNADVYIDNAKAGGIACFVNSNGTQTFENCVNNGDVYASKYDAGGCGAGGIVGLGMTGGARVFTNCSNTGAITVGDARVNIGSMIAYKSNGGVNGTSGNTARADIPAITSYSDNGGVVVNLNFATVDGTTATFVADNALAAGNAYKVMAPKAAPVLELTEAGQTVSFDTNLVVVASFAGITVADGLDRKETAEGGIVTFTAAAPLPDWPDLPAEFPADADDAVKAKYADWATQYGVKDATGKSAAFLMNVDPNGAVPELTIKSIAVEGNVATIVVTTTGEEFDLSTINGVLFVSATDDLAGEWTTTEVAMPTGDVGTTATFTVGSSNFMKAKVGFKVETPVNE